jgi:hypothetical protein
VGPERPWDANPGIPGEVAGEPLRVPRLRQIIQLHPQRAAELLKQAIQIHPPAQRRVKGKGADHHLQRGEIRRQQPLDARPLHLHHHRRPIREPRPVDLTQGGSRDGDGLESPEGRFQRLPQLGLQQRTDPLEGLSRHLILEPGQLLGHEVRQEIHPCAQELTQLDQRTAQLHRQIPERGRPAPVARRRRLPDPGRAQPP